MTADTECPNCGLSNYYPTDPASAFYPFCDRRCHAAYEERRLLRAMHRDLLFWSIQAHLDPWRHRLAASWRTAALHLRIKR